MSTRDDLIAALLADPTDMLLRMALADAIEEEGIAHVPALVRVLPVLVEARPQGDWSGRNTAVMAWVQRRGKVEFPLRELKMPVSRSHGQHGIHGFLRLAGIATTHVTARDLLGGDARTAMLRHLLVCELYAARVIDATSRDHLGYQSHYDFLDAIDQDYSRFWTLRGGSAGIAIQAMLACEQMHLASVYNTFSLKGDFFGSIEFEDWKRTSADRRSAFAQIRLRHLAILDCLASLKDAWAAALALYHEYRRKVREEWSAVKAERARRANEGLRAYRPTWKDMYWQEALVPDDGAQPS